MATDLSTLAESLSKFTGLLETIYVDLAQPGVKQAGKALETSLGLGNTLLLPITLLNERSRIVFQRNMENYRAQMESVPPEDVIPVAPEIGVPIIEKLTYVSDEQLSSMYANLLASASDASHAKHAHPSFVNIINNISPDEAALITEFSNDQRIPVLKALAKRANLTSTVDLGVGHSKRTAQCVLFPGNLLAYFSNLSGLGIVDIDWSRWIADEDLYKAIEESIKHAIDDQMKRPDLQEYQVVFKKGMVEITPFGATFIRACTKPPEIASNA